MSLQVLIQEWDGTEETVTISTNNSLLRRSSPRRPGEGFLVQVVYPDGERQVVEDAYVRSITLAEEWPQKREQPLPWELEAARRARVRRALAGMRVRYW
jgi:hypothetical protein